MSLITDADTPGTPIHLIRPEDLETWLGEQPETTRAWLERQRFKAETGTFAWLPDAAGTPAAVAAGWDGKDDLNTLGALPLTLAEGTYRLASPVSALQVLGWGLGSYQFSRYREPERSPADLVIPPDVDADAVTAQVEATTLVRDLINEPAERLNPERLAAEARALAEWFDGEFTETVGDDLLAAGFNTIHAVGRAATVPPRLIDLSWGDADAPRVTLVGKGVCFDSGGLDLKPASNMRTMKKDMGGAACVLGLAHLIMAAKLPVRLRVLIPAVENAVAGNAYRPGDIIRTYKGITVEVDNTDAEGRLVMCDALALAAEETPEVLVDYSTLTGSARSAVGAEIAALFANNDALADGIFTAGQTVDDPVWRLPLHAPYEYKLKSTVAETTNSASVPYAGAVTAALFLNKFVDDVPWAHFDIMAYNIRSRPGRPEGGEAMAVRAVFEHLKARFGG